jgi:hypothetical protein
VYDGRSKEEILQTYAEFCRDAKVNRKVVSILSDVIQSNPPVKLKPGYLKTHLRSGKEYDMRECHGMEYIPADDIHEIVVEDIHLLRGER